MPDSSNTRPIGAMLNIEKGSMVSAPEGRLRLTDSTRSFSRICGELPTMVMVPPRMMQQAMGSSRRDNGRPVRVEIRATTGRNNAVTAGFCMTAEISPVMPHRTSSRRRSSPFDRRRMCDAAVFSTPVRSSPAPRIIVAMIATTALPAKPSNNCSVGTTPVMPSATSTSSATTSARTHSSVNMTSVNVVSPSTSSISLERVRPLSMVLVGGGVVPRV